jgi:hypothetical protein
MGGSLRLSRPTMLVSNAFRLHDVGKAQTGSESKPFRIRGAAARPRRRSRTAATRGPAACAAATARSRPSAVAARSRRRTAQPGRRAVSSSNERTSQMRSSAASNPRQPDPLGGGDAISNLRLWARHEHERRECPHLEPRAEQSAGLPVPQTLDEQRHCRPTLRSVCARGFEAAVVSGQPRLTRSSPSLDFPRKDHPEPPPGLTFDFD